MRKLKQSPDLYGLKIAQMKSKHQFNASQRNQTKKYIQDLITENRMVQQSAWVELDFPGFCAYQQSKRGLSLEEARALWEREKTHVESRWVKDQYRAVLERYITHF